MGIFGLSSHTDERILRRIFSKFGHINNIHLVYDRGVRRYIHIFVGGISEIHFGFFFKTNRSRGFGFIYYDRIEDAKEV